MKKILKFFHLIGMAMFVGSILTYLVVSAVSGQAGVAALPLARKIISEGTVFLTLPGMWVLAVSGVLLGYKYYGLFRQGWVAAKLIATLVIILNAHLVVVPAASKALIEAVESASLGVVTDGYGSAYMRESIFGAINLLLAFFATVAGIWKFKKRQAEG